MEEKISIGLMEFETIFPRYPFEFEDVNDFVHDAQYEDLQNLCLSMAVNFEAERKAWITTMQILVFASSLVTSIMCYAMYVYLF